MIILKFLNLLKNLDAHFQLDAQVTPKINGDVAPVKFQVDAENIFKVRKDPIIIGLEERSFKWDRKPYIRFG